MFGFMNSLLLLIIAGALLTLQGSEVNGDHRGEERTVEGTIAFATVGRTQYAFDVYKLSLPDEFLAGHEEEGDALKQGYWEEERLTDGKSVNYNGHLLEDDDDAKLALLDWIKKSGGITDPAELRALDAALKNELELELELLTYISERGGSLRIFFNLILGRSKQSAAANGEEDEILIKKWGEVSEAGHAHQRKNRKTILGSSFSLGESSDSVAYLHDRPQIGGGRIVFVSTEQAAERERESWTAVYSSSLAAPAVVRLTPKGVSDYSPAISPSGKWVLAASLQNNGWNGEVQELQTDLYVFDAADGSQRKLVTRHAGWPSWGDDSTIFFHRQAEDGWWSVFKISLPEDFFVTERHCDLAETRVTPPGVHAFTPSASRTGEWIAVATRRPGSDFRHVEVYDLRSQKFVKLTENISPYTNHYNPFVSVSSKKIVYHRCRGNNPHQDAESIIPLLQPQQSAIPGLAILLVDGKFPSFSHDGSHVAYIPDLGWGGIYVTKSNGEGKRMIFSGVVFGLAWDWKRKGVVYTSLGVPFAKESSTVHIISVFNADADESLEAPQYKQLTKEGTGNNAFPSPSPDGNYLVFRSGRTGHKNLYIMDAVNGEEWGIRQLTDGPWTDTMPNWSPTGEWIAFSSNRENETAFAGYLIRPDGTGLHKILGGGGRVNHLYFSPDGKSLVFTSDFAAVSAEPISVPHQYQPYGTIFISRIDGSAVQRLTHNPYEDGTPYWCPTVVNYSDLSADRGDPVDCNFDDVYWLAKDVGEHHAYTKAEVVTTWCPHSHQQINKIIDK